MRWRLGPSWVHVGLSRAVVEERASWCDPDEGEKACKRDTRVNGIHRRVQLLAITHLRFKCVDDCRCPRAREMAPHVLPEIKAAEIIPDAVARL